MASSAAVRHQQISAPRVLTGEAPDGFTMPGEIDNRKIIAHES